MAVRLGELAEAAEGVAAQEDPAPRAWSAVADEWNALRTQIEALSGRYSSVPIKQPGAAGAR